MAANERQDELSSVAEPAAPTPPEIGVDPTCNILRVDASGSVFWNGQTVSLATLRRCLESSQNLASSPELRFQADPDAGYTVVAAVLDIIRPNASSRTGLIGSDRHLRGA